MRNPYRDIGPIRLDELERIREERDLTGVEVETVYESNVFSVPLIGMPSACARAGCSIERHYDPLRMEDVFTHIAPDGTRDAISVLDMLDTAFDNHLSVEKINAWIRSLHPEEGQG